MMESMPEVPKAEEIERILAKQPHGEHTEAPGPMTVNQQRLLDRIESDFNRHALDEAGTVKSVYLRDRLREIALAMVMNVPEGRELSTALTHLESAMFYATAGIARKGPIA